MSTSQATLRSDSRAVELATTSSPRSLPWLVSPAVDLAAFGGSTLVSLLLLAVGWQLGLLESETPDWTWIGVVLLVDVAHVYATTFRAYFDTVELRRRPWLYGLTPLAGWLRTHARNRFLLTAPPLRLPGAVGSPTTPIATV